MILSIIAGKIILDNVDKDQRDLLNNFIDFKKRAKPRNREKKKKQKEIQLKV